MSACSFIDVAPSLQPARLLSDSTKTALHGPAGEFYSPIDLRRTTHGSAKWRSSRRLLRQDFARSMRQHSVRSLPARWRGQLGLDAVMAPILGTNGQRGS